MFSLVGRSERLIASLDPILIYRKPKEVERNFRDVVDARGQRMLELWIEAHDKYPFARKAQTDGYPGFIAFWEEFAEISDRKYPFLICITLARRTVATARWCGGLETDDRDWRLVYGKRSFATPKRDQDSDGQ